MKRDQARLRLLTDPRLSDSARVLGLYVESLGDGPHEIDRVEFRRVLYGTPSKDRVARALSELELHGWLERSIGGRGHHDSFSFTVAEIQTVSDTVPETPTLSADSVAESQTLKAPVVVGEEAVVNPPVVPPVVAEAETAIATNEILAGCRGAMRDYLRERVPQHRQVGFVWSAVGWLNSNGFAWLNDEGALTPPDVRPGLLANALNQLLASDEKGYKAPVGDPRNLLQKLRIICGQHGIERKSNGHREPASAAGPGRGGSGGTPAAAGAGKGGRIFTEYTPGTPHGPTGNGA